MNERPPLDKGPTLVQVPQRGLRAGMASVLVVAILAGAVGISLLGGGGETSSASPSLAAALATTAPPAGLTPRATLARPTPAFGYAPTPGPTGFRTGPVAPTGGTQLPDVAHAVPADDGGPPLPLGTISDVPNPDRLDFLVELCMPGCFRDAHWIDPRNPSRGSGTWTAGRPFHVREGFVNDGAAPLGDGFDVILYVTRLGGPDALTYRYASDYVLRGTSDRCGPTYATQAQPTTCEWFVHDFPDGLSEGRWAIWAVWEAPCRAWLELGVISWCDDPDRVLALFASGFDAPYGESDPDYTESSS